MRAHVLTETAAADVVAKRDPARVSVRVGSVSIITPIDEALTLANDIADAVATLRAAHPRERP